MDPQDKDQTPVEDQTPAVEVEVEGEGESQTPEYSEEETLAISRGWKPKEEWDGPEDEWKPAKAFNEYGELKERLLEKEKEAKKLNKVVQLMKDHHLRVREAAYNDAIKSLKAERAAALEKEDFSKAELIRDQIDDLKDRAENDQPLPDHIEEVIEQNSQEPDPAFFQFLDRNPWYKPGSSDPASKKADSLGYAYAQANPDWDFKDIIKEVEKDIRKLYPEKFERPRQVVNEPGSRAAGSRPSTEKVKLSAEQLEIAKAFDMTPEEYAKQLKTYGGR
jgi:hypothetical protein